MHTPASRYQQLLFERVLAHHKSGRNAVYPGPVSGDTTPCKVTPVILHGVVSPDWSDLHPLKQQPWSTRAALSAQERAQHALPGARSGCVHFLVLTDCADI